MPTYQEWLADQTRQRQAAQSGTAGAQSNMTNAQARYNNSISGPRGGGSQENYDALVNLNNVANAAGNANRFDPNSPENRAEGNRLQAYDLAHAGVDRLANDPTDQFIRRALQSAAGPEGGPYNATTRNAMFTGAMESSGSNAQVQSIMDSAAQRGLTANDPTVQAALRRVQGEQAQAGQRARLGIDTVANPANYAAQQSAVNRLGDYNSGRQQQQQSAEDRLREMLWNEGVPRGAAGAQVAPVNMGGGPSPVASAPQGGSYQQQIRTAPSSNGGLAVAPRVPDMSGWTPAQRSAYTGQPAPAQRSAAVPPTSTPYWQASGSAGAAWGANPTYQGNQQAQQPAQTQVQRPIRLIKPPTGWNPYNNIRTPGN